LTWIAIWEYIAEDSVDAADRWIGKLFDAFEALAQAPGMGISAKISLTRTVLAGRRYLILYRVEASGLRLWPLRRERGIFRHFCADARSRQGRMGHQ